MKETIVLAYSGGLQSSIAIPWLMERYASDVVTISVGLGQPTDLVEIRDRALAAGAVRAHVLDAREEFARDFVLPSLKADALADGRYPMATGLARPLIVKKLIELARIEQTVRVAHASRGRDRLRVSTLLRTLDPAMDELTGVVPDAQASALAQRLGMFVPGPADDRVDANLWGRTVSRPGGDVAGEAPEAAFKLTRALAHTPATPAVVEVAFAQGAPTAINGVAMPFSELIDSLATIAGEHGAGRLERIKHHPSGSRSRVIYEVPAAVILHLAHSDLDQCVAAANLGRVSRSVAANYADVIERGEWFDRLRLSLDAFVATNQQPLTGAVRVKLFKGHCSVVGRTLAP